MVVAERDCTDGLRKPRQLKRVRVGAATDCLTVPLIPALAGAGPTTVAEQEVAAARAAAPAPAAVRPGSVARWAAPPACPLAAGQEAGQAAARAAEQAVGQAAVRAAIVVTPPQVAYTIIPSIIHLDFPLRLMLMATRTSSYRRLNGTAATIAVASKGAPVASMGHG